MFVVEVLFLSFNIIGPLMKEVAILFSIYILIGFKLCFISGLVLVIHHIANDQFLLNCG